MQIEKKTDYGGGILSSSFRERFLLLGLFLPLLFLFCCSIPDLREAQNNTQTPRPLDFQAVQQNSLDLVHNYVTVTGTLSKTVFEQGEDNDPHEILYDNKTGIGILIGHFRSHTPPRQTATPNVTLTGMVKNAPSWFNEVPSQNYPKLDDQYYLIEGKKPGSVTLLIAGMVVEIVVFLIFAFLAYKQWLAPRLRPDMPEDTQTTEKSDWKKFDLN